MEKQREPISVIKIGNKDLEESDVAIINVILPTRQISIGLATRHDGEGEIYVSKKECTEILDSLAIAIKRVEELESE
ncbi:MAG: hypothetical protein M1539_00015 [Actinobacteria bacterium]|nr:hypothetical protein [Actinomycetota bacterium]MCL5882362.1 hypothetical protein [Actinomycetota bacterium]